MWRWLSRILLAFGFLVVVGVVVLNGGGAAAQGSGTRTVFLPYMQGADSSLHDYIGLVRECEDGPTCNSDNWSDFYTVRGDKSGWSMLAEHAYTISAAWSPDGAYFVYAQQDVDEPARVLTWLVDLATRQPRLLAEHPLVSLTPKWSPDSGKLALIGADRFYVFDVGQDTLTVHEVPVTMDLPVAEHIVWSDDSHHFAWVEGSYDPHDVWVWVGAEQGARRVYEGLVNLQPLYWSPDGIRLLINGRPLDTGGAHLYESNLWGEPAHLWLDNFLMRGWMDDGTKLILLRNSKVYLASTDATTVTLFFDSYGVYPQGVYPSPSGEMVAMSTFQGLYIKQVNQTYPYFVDDCFIAQWRADGERFVCYDRWVPHSFVVDVAGPALMVLHTLDDYADPADFLPNSEHLLGINRYLGDGPKREFKGSYLFNMNTGRFYAFYAPDDQRVPILEWRYMP